MNIGLQLYSMREDTSKNFVKTLKRVAEIGYDGVEFAGYGEIPASDMKRYLDEFGLKAAGSHVGYALVKRDINSVLDYCSKLAVQSAVIPSAHLTTKEEWLSFAEELNVYGKIFKENGILFGYHNHGHEFAKIEDKYVLDIIFENTDPEYVMCELDTYHRPKTEILTVIGIGGTGCRYLNPMFDADFFHGSNDVLDTAAQSRVMNIAARAKQADDAISTCYCLLEKYQIIKLTLNNRERFMFEFNFAWVSYIGNNRISSK